VEVAGGTGAVARIIARLIECAREIVPTARDSQATSAALPAAAASNSSVACESASSIGAPIVDRFGVTEGVPFVDPLYKRACGPCAHIKTDGSAPNGYCAQCGYYRHVDTSQRRVMELQRYCLQCQRPCCFECSMAELDSKHKVIPLPNARDHLKVRVLDGCI